MKLTETERDYLAEVVESSVRVVTRHHFFVWTQSTLQRLIPHEILLCGVDDGSRYGFEQYHFESTRYFRDCHFEALCDLNLGLLPHLQRIHERTRGLVVTSPSFEPDAGSTEDSLSELVRANELRNLAAGLWIGPRSAVQAYYSFSRIPELDERTGYFLELLVPHIHITFRRVLAATDAASSSNGARPGRLITRRQEEILLLIRDGKTNNQIAEILEVSPWTIKNHVQMIFQRLNTSNRTQAITRAMKLGILRPE